MHHDLDLQSVRSPLSTLLRHSKKGGVLNHGRFSRKSGDSAMHPWLISGLNISIKGVLRKPDAHRLKLRGHLGNEE